jgi:hypothetical protein
VHGAPCTIVQPPPVGLCSFVIGCENSSAKFTNNDTNPPVVSKDPPPLKAVAVSSRLRALSLTISAIVVLLGLRVSYLFAEYTLGSTAQRFHVESAALLFVAVGFVLKLARSQAETNQLTIASCVVPKKAWLAFCGLALALYWSSLSVGFLSDDFFLASYAARWMIGPITPVFFRPLPMLVWSLMLEAGAGPRAFHLINIILHGTNAYLAAVIVAGWVRSTKWSLLAGLIVLTAPLAPEAVVWCSGMFDVLSTTLVLGCVLAARRYSERVSLASRVLFIALGIASLASKESAAVAVGLVWLDAWARQRVTRTLFIDSAILGGVVGLASAIRVVTAFGVAKPPLTRYLVQRVLFGSFGSLAVPWHIEVSKRLPWLAILVVLALIFLLLVFFLKRGFRQQIRLAVAAAAWVLLPIITVYPVFGVLPELQGSRYLYLSTIGWAALVVVLAGGHRGRTVWVDRLSAVPVIGLIIVSSYGTVQHLKPWMEAAQLRDRVEASAVKVGMHLCRTIRMSNVPDSLRGAYVFRVGLSEALARDVGLSVTRVLDGADCSFQWSATDLAFVRTTAK